MASAAPLEIRSVTDQVYGVLLRRIVAGDLPPGAKLRQEALAHEFGVSRTPLREALRRLSSEGFVEFTVNLGARVHDRDLSEPRSVRLARLHVEPATARLAAEVRHPVGLEALGAAAEPSVRDGARARAADAAFHLAIAATTGNPYLVRFAEMLWMTRPDPALAPEDGETDEGHAAIAAAIERGDGAAAERLSLEHLGG